MSKGNLYKASHSKRSDGSIQNETMQMQTRGEIAPDKICDGGSETVCVLIRSMLRTAILGLALAGVCLAEGPRILIVTDMEGISGINNPDEQLLPGQRRYEEARKLLTGEVNAAVQGAVVAGASEVVVWDGHDGSRILSVADIHPFAKLLQGSPTPANFYFSEKRYDGIIFVGQHPMAGANGVLSHTQSFTMKRVTINGKPVGELGQVAAIAGYFDIPVIMLTGDKAACEEMIAMQPKAVTVPVKQIMGRASSLSLSHEQATSRIREAAQNAVSRVKDFSPWKISGRVEMRFEYHPQPPKEREGRLAIYRGRTVLEAYEDWLGKP